MSKGIRISHSAKETYMQCPFKWKLHYQDKLRSTRIGSPLFFGSSFDDALTRLLLDKKPIKTEEEQALMDSTPEGIFSQTFAHTKINGKEVDLRESSQANYFKSDLDLELLNTDDRMKIMFNAEKYGISLNDAEDIAQFVEECQEQFKTGLDENTQIVYNMICWRSLHQKGLLLLDAYRQQIMPQIEEVYEIQKKISIKDEEDEFIGYIDVICSFVDEPGVRYVCDNKTSSRAYSKDSVSVSEQLAAYAEAESNRKCAYIVMEKKLRKREPRTRSSIIKDVIGEEILDTTFNNITHTLESIKEEKFEKNMDSCFAFGQKCPYYDYCRDGSMKNLEYLEYKEKKDAKSNNKN